MNHLHRTLVAIAVLLVLVISGCSNKAGSGEHQEAAAVAENRGEHDRDGGEHEGEGGEGAHGEEGEGGEESGTEYPLDATYDRVRNGARLILAYDAESNAFVGTVANTTSETLERVRIEVHLSNGKELGPTTPADLGPGEKIDVKLTATSTDFDGWNAHPEVGSGEHGHEGGEHGGEGGEHDGEGDEHGGEG